MITIPAIILLGIFAVLFLILFVMMAAHLYHGYRFGRHDPLTMWVNTAFVAAVIGVVTITVTFLVPVDWSGNFTLESPTFNPGSELQDLELPTTPDDLPSLFPTP